MKYKIKFNEDYIIDVSYDYSPMRKNTYDKVKTVELKNRELNQAIDEKTKKLDLGFGRRATLTQKELMVKRTFTYKKLFDKNTSFKTKNGLNIIVGDNGCGKTTLIKKFIEDNKIKNMFFVDMEKTNPTITKPDPEKGITYSPEEILNQFMWSIESHGETREGVLMAVLTLDFDFLILDEPEQGLSLKNQKKYYDKLVGLDKDIIVVTHSKIFVESTLEVFDVETMKWINSEDYLNSI